MKKVALFISASVLAFSFPAYAQNTSAGDDRTETKNAGLEDIIVTAQRRDESAQRIERGQAVERSGHG